MGSSWYLIDDDGEQLDVREEPVEWPSLGRRLFERFASRKLLIAASTIIALIVAGAYTEAAAVALGYLGIQGLKDSRV